MAQLIYSILALFLIMFLSMNMQRGIGKDQQNQSLNEVTTQLTGAGTEVLERIGATYFDRYHPTNLNAEPYCGLLQDSPADRAQLFDEGAYMQCGAFGTCTYIEGFSQLSTTVVRGQFEFTVTVDSVFYVDPTTYNPTSGTKTFAKRVDITVENPYLYLGDDPTNTFDLKMSRVFTYGCATQNQYMPYHQEPADPCPGTPPPCLLRP